jgi:uncharacterized protein YndB with AHSA1/START domain
MSRTYEVETTAEIAAPINKVWDIINDTGRYAEWVDIVDEVIDHHGPARPGLTYSENYRVLGPIRTRTVWTVREVEPQHWRLDSGTGLAPLKNFVVYFKFDEVSGKPSTTAFTYGVRYQIGLGPLGKVIQPLLASNLRKGFDASIRNLRKLALDSAASI